MIGILEIIAENIGGSVMGIILDLLIGISIIFIIVAIKKIEKREKRKEVLLISKEKIAYLATTVTDVFRYGSIIINTYIKISNTIIDKATYNLDKVTYNLDKATYNLDKADVQNEFDASVKELREFLIYNKHKIPKELATAIYNYISNITKDIARSINIQNRYMYKHKDDVLVNDVDYISEISEYLKPVLKEFEKNKDNILKLLTEIERDYEKY